jgi:hypothetical protein
MRLKKQQNSWIDRTACCEPPTELSQLFMKATKSDTTNEKKTWHLTITHLDGIQE